MTRVLRSILRYGRDAAAPASRRVLAWINGLMVPFLRDTPTPAPVFIIGAPRSGSTILYQALTNALDLLYIDNLTARFHFNLFLGMWLSKRRYRNIPHGNFEANYGDTRAHGGHAPSECGTFWYQWLPRDRHFVATGETSQRDVAQIRFAVTFPSQWFGRPILFKNLNAGQRLQLICEAFPEARIIFIQRDLDATARSILQARRKFNVPAGTVWSVRPRICADLGELPEEEMCREQVRRLEAQIDEDLKLFPASQIFRVSHSDLSPALIDRLRQWIGVGYRDGYSLPVFQKAPSAKG
ncbi:sulfotransferase [Notoacmeibacter sp. MSK16QG-6]|uniref:sulfotransferase n=1 Tax=Notoacmeibacter sp. MSK16QG-6 TaxID=2957982 RepID=UPI00209F8ECC|nr:sulfotransferase [Notoacmeibacter sp. MSK16QG-6]MCP1198063.1 sulfotransferase [Notoacmeibacter sp. MSK16QG-6]